MIQLFLEVDENGDLDAESFSEQLVMFDLIDKLTSDLYDTKTEFECLLSVENILLNGSSKYMLNLINAIGKYHINRNKIMKFDKEYPSQEEHQCNIVRKRIKYLLDHISERA